MWFRGHVKIETLEQKFVNADLEMARLLNIEVGDTVNYRVVVIETEEPLIYAISLIAVERLENDFKEGSYKGGHSYWQDTQKTQYWIS